ncbi:uncharacterized protein LOC111253163 [Varroa destructor]|uniref:Uncharacterized protein n=1 Tax=Varroa destructor TaxID=109461 RepID=A0A7M7MDA1_VARDE|nr:uncharacterized protein LOC111253163 [Varroa destructor]
MSSCNKRHLAGAMHVQTKMSLDQLGRSCGRSWHVARLVTASGNVLPDNQLIQRRRISIVDINTGQRTWSGTCNFIDSSVAYKNAGSIDKKLETHKDTGKKCHSSKATKLAKRTEDIVLDYGGQSHSRLDLQLGNSATEINARTIQEKQCKSVDYVQVARHHCVDKNRLSLNEGHLKLDLKTDVKIEQADVSKLLDVTNKVSDLVETSETKEVTNNAVTNREGRLQSQNQIRECNSDTDTQLVLNQGERKNTCDDAKAQSKPDFHQLVMPMTTDAAQRDCLLDMPNTAKGVENSLSQVQQVVSNSDNIDSDIETQVVRLGISGSFVDSQNNENDSTAESGQKGKHCVANIQVSELEQSETCGVAQHAVVSHNGCKNQEQQFEFCACEIMPKIVYQNNDATTSDQLKTARNVFNVSKDKAERSQRLPPEYGLRVRQCENLHNDKVTAHNDDVDIQTGNEKSGSLQMLPEIYVQQPLIDKNVDIHKVAGSYSMKQHALEIADSDNVQGILSQTRVQEYIKLSTEGAPIVQAVDRTCSEAVLNNEESRDDKKNGIQRLQVNTANDQQADPRLGGEATCSSRNGAFGEEKQVPYINSLPQLEPHGDMSVQYNTDMYRTARAARQSMVNEIGQTEQCRIEVGVQSFQPNRNIPIVYGNTQSVVSIPYSLTKTVASVDDRAKQSPPTSTTISQSLSANWEDQAEVSPSYKMKKRTETMTRDDEHGFENDATSTKTDAVIESVWQTSVYKPVFVRAIRHLEDDAVQLQWPYTPPKYEPMHSSMSVVMTNVHEEGKETENKAEVLNRPCHCCSNTGTASKKAEPSDHEKPTLATLCAERNPLDLRVDYSNAGCSNFKTENLRGGRRSTRKLTKDLHKTSFKSRSVVNKNVWLPKFTPEVAAEEQFRDSEWQNIPRVANTIPDQISRLTTSEYGSHHLSTNVYDYVEQSDFEGHIPYPSPSEWDIPYHGPESMVNLVGANVTLVAEASERTPILGGGENDLGHSKITTTTTTTAADEVLVGMDHTDLAHTSSCDLSNNHRVDLTTENMFPAMHTDVGENLLKCLTEPYIITEQKAKPTSIMASIFPVNKCRSFLETQNRLDIGEQISGVYAEATHYPPSKYGQPATTGVQDKIADLRSSSCTPLMIQFSGPKPQTRNEQGSLSPDVSVGLPEGQIRRRQYSSLVDLKCHSALTDQPDCLIYTANNCSRKVNNRPRRRQRLVEQSLEAIPQQSKDYIELSPNTESLPLKIFNGVSDRPSMNTGSSLPSAAANVTQTQIKRPRLISIETTTFSSPNNHDSTDPTLAVEVESERSLNHLCAPLTTERTSDFNRHMESSHRSQELDVSKLFNGDLVSAVDAELDEAQRNFEFTTWENFVGLVERVHNLTTLRKQLILHRQQAGKENVMNATPSMSCGFGISVADIANLQSPPGDGSSRRTGQLPYLQEKQDNLPNYGMSAADSNGHASIRLHSGIVDQNTTLSDAYFKAVQSDKQTRYNKEQLNINNNYLTTEQHAITNADSLKIERDGRLNYERPLSSLSTNSDATIIVNCMAELGVQQ